MQKYIRLAKGKILLALTLCLRTANENGQNKNLAIALPDFQANWLLDFNWPLPNRPGLLDHHRALLARPGSLSYANSLSRGKQHVRVVKTIYLCTNRDLLYDSVDGHQWAQEPHYGKFN